MCNSNMPLSIIVQNIDRKPGVFIKAVKEDGGVRLIDFATGDTLGFCELNSIKDAFVQRKEVYCRIASNGAKGAEIEFLHADYFFVLKTEDYPERTFFNVSINGDKLVIRHRITDGVIAQVDPTGLHAAFRIRPKQAAVVRKVQGGVSLVQIVRHVDIHRHSGFSFLDGSTRVSDMVKKTEYAGALTDHGGMYGTLEYYGRMTAEAKLPILGFEAYAETIHGKKEGNHLLLLAKTEKGYHNLAKLTSLAQENFYRKPHVSYDMLADYGEDIISTTTCMGSEVNQLLLSGKYDEAKYVTKHLSRIFGKENFYVEVQRHGFEEELIVNPQLKRLAKDLGLKLVAATDAHYLHEEDRTGQEVLICIGTKKLMSDEDRMTLPGTGYHIHSPEEMEERFKDIPEALDSTVDIAEQCAGFSLTLGKNYLPRFDVPAPFKDEMSYLRHLTKEGFKNRFEGTPAYHSAEYHERVKYELDVIENMGFPGYFLIVSDFIRYAKSKGIMVGPGRGSAAGSEVAYCLDITDLDPIPYGLLFERFLNPDRISMPDIDVDFPDDRRDEVIEYVREKYGESEVSKIITFQTLGAKSAMKDTGRVMGLPISVRDKFGKTIPERPGITLHEAYEESGDFRKLVDGDPLIKRVYETAKTIEGLPRNPSIHACGLIISPGEVSDYIPLTLMENKKKKIKEWTSQYTMGQVEETGLLKMDFLGLRTMTVISHCQALVNKKREKQGLEPIHYLDIPLGEPEAYKTIAEGDTFGIFQLESGGMRSFMTDLFDDVDQFTEPSKELFERLIAGVSLYRPGPMDYIPEYIENMKNPHNIRYDHPLLEPILKATYGVIVYQEQTMQIVRSMAGFTKGEADNVRKAFAKKKQDMIGPLREKFMAGCEANDIDKQIAEKVWVKMEKFGSYAFNKSHAAVYSMLSNATAWFKTHHPLEFWAATLNSFMGKYKKLRLYLSVIKKRDIQILKPDVNRSDELFSVEEDGIRFGLKGLKGIGKNASSIVAERESSGEFDDFRALVDRLVMNGTGTKTVVEGLIYSGASDSFTGTRAAKLSVYSDMIEDSKRIKKEQEEKDQLSMFDLLDQEELQTTRKAIPIPVMKEIMEKIMLEFEKETAGFYITAHPLDDYRELLIKEGVMDIGFLVDESEDEEGHTTGGSADYEGETLKLAGIITSVETFYTKRDNKPIRKIVLEDESGEFECVAFEQTIHQNDHHLREGKIVIVTGEVRISDFGPSLTIRTVVDADERKLGRVPAQLRVVTDDKRQAREFFNFVASHPGKKTKASVVFQGQEFVANVPVDASRANYMVLEEMFGNKLKVIH